MVRLLKHSCGTLQGKRSLDVGDFSVTAAHTITDVSLKAGVVHIATDRHQEV